MPDVGERQGGHDKDNRIACLLTHVYTSKLTSYPGHKQVSYPDHKVVSYLGHPTNSHYSSAVLPLFGRGIEVRVF